MAMSSAAKTSFFAIVFFASFAGVHGAEVHDVFNTYRTEILAATSAVTYNGYAFSTGKTTPVSDTRFSREAALKKSRHRALVGFLSLGRNDVKWPPELPPTIRSRIYDQFLVLDNSAKGYVEKTVALEQGAFDNSTCYTVLAISSDNLRVFPPSFNEILGMLKNSFQTQDKRLNLQLFLEICPAESIDDVTVALGKRLGEKYGKGVQSVITGTKLLRTPKMWLLTKVELDNSLSSSNSIEKAMILLGQLPYNPQLCYMIAENLDRMGFHRNAQLFYQRGTIWHIDKEFNDKCEKKLSSKCFSLQKNDYSGILGQIENEYRDELTNGRIAFNPYPTAKIIVNSFGSVPIKDNSLQTEDFQRGSHHFFTSPPEINQALKCYLESMETSLNADTCNMIGACLRENGDFALALPFLTQAIRMKPNHKYALVNYLLTLELLGKGQHCVQIANALKECDFLDAWGKDNVQRVLENETGKIEKVQ